MVSFCEEMGSSQKETRLRKILILVLGLVELGVMADIQVVISTRKLDYGLGSWKEV